MCNQLRELFLTGLAGLLLGFWSLISNNIAYAHDFGGDPNPEPPPSEERSPCDYNCCSGGGGQDGGSGAAASANTGGGDGFTGGRVGDPIHMYDGALRYARVDMTVGTLFPIIIRRTYDSRAAYDSRLGYGWALNHDRRLFEYPDNSIGIRTGCGVRTFFVEAGGAYVTPTGGLQGTLTELPGGGFEFHYTNGSFDRFDADGHLVAAVSQEGHWHEYVYDPAGLLPLTGTSPFSVDPSRPMTVAYMPRLTRVQARSADGQLTGDAVDFIYDDDTGRLIRIEASDSREVVYTHDDTDDLTLGKLMEVQGLDDLYYAYGYDDPDHPHRLTSIQEGMGGTPVLNDYDDQGRVIAQTNGDSVLELDYYEVSTPHTKVTREIYDDQGQLLHAAENTVWFDANGYFEKEVNPLGHEWRQIRDGNQDIVRDELLENDGGQLTLKRAVDFTYDGQHRKLSETVTLESGDTITRSWSYEQGRVASEQVEQVVSGAGSSEQFRTEYTYHHDTNNRPTTLHEIKRRNFDGSFSITTHSYCEPSEIGQPGSTCPFEGLLKTVDGPRTDVSDVTAYAYYSSTDQSGCDTGGLCHRKGDLHTITNALGHVAEFTRYDRAGRVTEIEDVNGVVTELTYHPRGWLISLTVRDPVGSADATTAYSYDDRGNPTRITLPDDSYIDYTYDGRNRLTEITDNLGNRIEYVLDSEGNRLAENTYDPQDTLTRTMSMEYDALSRIQAALNAQSQATQFTYDGRGNQLTQTDALSVVTQQEYDALDRLVEITQDVGGIDAESALAYDAAGNLTEVTDPKGLSTAYEYDARGNLLTLVSPDTGTTSYDYDPADNQVSQIDARGVTTTYTYDALNRLTTIEYPDSDLDVAFFYDEDDTVTGCADSYPVGRLTQMIDESGTTIYCYDHRGNITRKAQVMGQLSPRIDYEYDLANRLEVINYYPSGRQIEYVRDAAGRLEEVVLNTLGGNQILVSDIENLPFGPVSEYQLGNQQTISRTYDQNYWVTDIQSPALQLHFRRDAVGNIDRLGTVAGAATPLEQYAYDNLYRLEDMRDDVNVLIEGYSYDTIGNRLSKTTASGSENYTYVPNHHWLDSVGSEEREYDQTGNTVNNSMGDQTFTYGSHGRLAGYKAAGGSANYQYNGLGERVAKQISGIPAYFIYDEAGRLLNEHTPGRPSYGKDYVYVDGVLVAVMEYGYSSDVYYVHADHLGTPRVVTDQAGAKRWEWAFQSNPFGEMLPDEDPESTGMFFTFNLRYPGQYYDAESGLHYNYFRDYEPGIGRYVQSDPIGLSGGMSTYAYVGENPLLYIDPFGLRGFFGYGPSDHYRAINDAKSGQARRQGRQAQQYARSRSLGNRCGNTYERLLDFITRRGDLTLSYDGGFGKRIGPGINLSFSITRSGISGSSGVGIGTGGGFAGAFGTTFGESSGFGSTISVSGGRGGRGGYLSTTVSQGGNSTSVGTGIGVSAGATATIGYSGTILEFQQNNASSDCGCR